MLAFLFAMMHCGISEYQGGAKVVIPFNGKITQSIYFKITIIGFANVDDRYICTDPQAVVRLQGRTKIADDVKAQAASHAGSEYKSRKYPRADGTSS